jgi:dinuclear metal center YbgI/SA1388 family protein
MAERDEILAYLDHYLAAGEFHDYGPQGLQVEGAPEVDTVVTGVSACAELFERAADLGAQLVLVHHGILWDRDSRVVRGALRRRLCLLLEHEMTLAAYHLCLDCHPELGNNILAARGLELRAIEPFGRCQNSTLGYRGTLPPTPVEALIERIDRFYGSDSLVFPSGPALVTSVGIISGGAQRELEQAIEAGLDMFVTGEAGEFVMHMAREAGIHFVASGHYNTERIGIRALGEHLANRFDVDVHFVDLPNPV